MKKTSLPTIVKIIQNELEERAPPDESEYEFVETWPKKGTPKTTNQNAEGESNKTTSH